MRIFIVEDDATIAGALEEHFASAQRLLLLRRDTPPDPGADNIHLFGF